VGEKLVFVDTGLPQYLEDIKKYVVDSGHRFQDVSFIINTHVHEDHVACNRALKDVCRAKLAVHELDAKYIENPDDFIKDTFKHAPPPEDYVKEANSWKDNVDIFLKDGDTIELDGVTLEVVHTPGHTQGSICLYDQERKILFSGDALQGTTAFVKEFGPVTGLYTDLDAYIRSIQRLLDLDVDMILPGHPDIIKNSDVRKELENCLERTSYINDKIVQNLQKTEMTLQKLTETLGIPVDEWNLTSIESHLRSLLNEGLVKKKGNFYSIL
jgi:glyoxylase-like metal-dependent hydrolase (beta-lactamase superfamily II)